MIRVDATDATDATAHELSELDPSVWVESLMVPSLGDTCVLALTPNKADGAADAEVPDVPVDAGVYATLALDGGFPAARQQLSKNTCAV
jgi:hypothetical protein